MAGGVDTEKGEEDLGQRFLGNTRTVIAHGNADQRFVRGERDLHRGALWRVPNRVHDDVLEGAAQQFPVAAHASFAARLILDPAIARIGFEPAVGDHLFHHLVQRQRFHLTGSGFAFGARHLQQGSYQVGEAADLLAEDLLSFGAILAGADEIGELGRAFDRMAERIATLLTAERRLLQDISHELRTPLARLSFAAELTRTAEDRDAAVTRMKKEIARLTGLVGGLIQVTRAEGDPAANSSESLRLDQLLGEVVDDCEVEADARGCRIAWAATCELTMRGDREVLRRARSEERRVGKE